MSKANKSPSKSVLRKDFLARRRALSDAERVAAEKEICARLEKLVADVPCFGAYAALVSEVNLDTLIMSALGRGQQVALPRMTEAGLSWHVVGRVSDLTVGVHGVREPQASAPKVLLNSLPALLVPGVSFTTAGDRLGSGGGYYDRVLAAYSGTSVGVCYACQLAGSLPTERHDQSVKCVVTEK